MPTRLVSQNINVSNSISKLTPLEEVVFIHLIVSVDDYGRFYGNPDILKGMLFPIREGITSEKIKSALNALESQGMIRRYRSNETEYLELTSWLNFQKPRAKASKFPDPEDSERIVTVENKCEQQKTKEPEDDSPVVIRMPLNTGEEYLITERAIKEYEELYPALDVVQEIRAMVGWLKADKKRLKTKSGIRRFIAGWLNRSQNSGSGAKRKENTAQNTAVIEYGENPFR